MACMMGMLPFLIMSTAVRLDCLQQIAVLCRYTCRYMGLVMFILQFGFVGVKNGG